MHLAFLSRKHHCLDSCGSPSVDDNSSILEDRPRGSCALDPSPSVVSAYGPFWEESLLPLRMVVSHMFDFSTLFASLRIAQDIYIHPIICRRPRISPDSSTLVSHFGTPSYMFPWMSGLRWRLYSEAIQFHASLSTQFGSRSVYHCKYDRCHLDLAAH